MVPDSFAYIHDAVLPVVMSTVITLCYLFTMWIPDSFYSLPNKAKRLQVMTVSSRNLNHEQQHREIKVIQKANRQIVDSKQEQPAMASVKGDTKKDQKLSTSQSNPQIPKEFKDLPYFYQDNRHMMCSIPLNIIPGLKGCPHLENIRNDCAKHGAEIPDLQAVAPITTDILTPQQYLEQERQGLIPRMKNHEVMQYLAKNLQDTTTQVISMKFNDLELQPKGNQPQ